MIRSVHFSKRLWLVLMSASISMTLLALIMLLPQTTQATILSAADMNIRVNDAASMMTLRLEVHPTNKPVFQAETQGAISDIAHAKYAPGQMVWVKFNPNDLTQVALDHS